MPTARQVYLSRLFEKRKGIVGKVASRYLQAGFSIEFDHPTRYGPVQIIARRGGEKLVIEVYDRGKVELDVIKLFHEKVKILKGKPVIVLYGAGVDLSEEAKNYCKDNNIRVKRIQV